jgi:membrane protein
MRYTSAYGAIGSFIALLLWCYYAISILFFGAEYVQAIETRRVERLGAVPASAGESSIPEDEIDPQVSKFKPRRSSVDA